MDGWKECSLQEIHVILAEILKSFADYCDRHSLRYYLVGGTLLGAIRHHGFIPWDDDIDVGMPREDYEHLLEVVKKDPIRNDLQLISGEDGTFIWPFAELIMLDTYVKRDSSVYIEDCYQVNKLFIDIFPQDGWPGGKIGQIFLLKIMKFYQFWFHLSKARFGRGTNTFRKILKGPFVLIANRIGPERIRDRIIHISKKRAFSESENVGSVSNAVNGIGECCKRVDVESYEKAVFEGHEYTIPGSWQSYLSKGYGINGDFMTLPPEEKRKTHKMSVYIKED